MTKVMKRVIYSYNRLLTIVENSNGLSEPQHESSTVDAISIVVSLVNDTLSSGGCYDVLALDIKNTFNSAGWSTHSVFAPGMISLKAKHLKKFHKGAAIEQFRDLTRVT